MTQEDSYSDYYSNESSYESFEDINMDELSITESFPTPWKNILMMNMDETQARQESEKKRNISVKQKVFCSKPVFVLENVANNKHRKPDNRIGDACVFEDEEDVSILQNSIVDNKQSNVLVRARGNRLTAKQSRVKARRIALKAK